jgi:arylformamidase
LPRKIIDASKPLIPDGSVDGPQTQIFESGDVRRPTARVSRVELPGDAGTHVLAPYFLDINGATMQDVDIGTFLGEGMVIRFKFDNPDGYVGEAEVKDGASSLLQRGDVVLLANLAGPEMAPTLTPDAAKWIVDRGAKMVGFDEHFHIDTAGSYETHRVFLEAGVPIIRNLVNLDQCGGGRFAAMALPLSVAGLASSPVRVLLLD